MPSSVIAKLKADTTVKITFGTNNNNNNNKDDANNHKDDEPRFVLGYWSIRGLAAPLRMMLCAAKVNHWVVMYDATDGGWNRDSWLHDKAWLRDEHNPFMNLPFLIDTKYGDDDPTTTIVNQTNAIFAYLGRELNMLGRNRLETTKCEELLAEVMDIRNAMTRFAYSNSPPETLVASAANLVASVQSNFEKFERHLATKYPDPNAEICFLVGDHLSAPDFHVWEMLVQYECLCQTYELTPFLQAWPRLEKFQRGFAGLRENQFYLNSFLARQLPYNNKSAQFGSSSGPGARYVRGQPTPWHKKGILELNCGCGADNYEPTTSQSH